MTGKNIKCNNCGASLSTSEGMNKIFCSYCGSENLLTDILEIPGLTLLCLKCNTRNKDENIYCDKCGSRLQKKCKFCSEMHPLNKKFCPKTGVKIEVDNKKKASIDLKILPVPAGTFWMGSNKHYTEEPLHQVTLNSFYISACEITNREFCLFLNASGNLKEKKVQWMEEVKNNFSGIVKTGKKFTVKEGYEKRPVVYVSWYGAVAFCNWLSMEEGFKKIYGEMGKRGNIDLTKKGYRLPTEAEWEMACRGESSTDYFWGDTMDDNYCWYCNNSEGNHHDAGTSGKVGHPNNFGLFDMSGNVWEWCNDWYGSYPSADLVNPIGPSSGSYKVVRGGSWKCEPASCRSASRSSLWAGSRSYTLGFRVAKTL